MLMAQLDQTRPRDEVRITNELESTCRTREQRIVDLGVLRHRMPRYSISKACTASIG
jgi:hypothetical protein